MSSHPTEAVLIAQFLDKKYPEQDLFGMSHHGIEKLIPDISLENQALVNGALNEQGAIPDTLLKSVLWHWMRLRDEAVDETHFKAQRV